MSATPNQTLKKNFETRAKLVEQLAGLVDKQHGDTTPEQVKSRLMGLANKKLLRLYQVEQKVREKFGTRDKMITHILGARKAAGKTSDDTVKASLEAFSKARLLDLTREKHGEKPAKQTPAERLAKKNGRKERERALSKIKK